jgi:hypothetical protein
MRPSTREQEAAADMKAEGDGGDVAESQEMKMSFAALADLQHTVATEHRLEAREKKLLAASPKSAKTEKNTEPKSETSEGQNASSRGRIITSMHVDSSAAHHSTAHTGLHNGGSGSASSVFVASTQKKRRQALRAKILADRKKLNEGAVFYRFRSEISVGNNTAGGSHSGEALVLVAPALISKVRISGHAYGIRSIRFARPVLPTVVTAVDEGATKERGSSIRKNSKSGVYEGPINLLYNGYAGVPTTSPTSHERTTSAPTPSPTPTPIPTSATTPKQCHRFCEKSCQSFSHRGDVINYCSG